MSTQLWISCTCGESFDGSLTVGGLMSIGIGAEWLYCEDRTLKIAKMHVELECISSGVQLLFISISFNSQWARARE